MNLKGLSLIGRAYRELGTDHSFYKEEKVSVKGSAKSQQKHAADKPQMFKVLGGCTSQHCDYFCINAFNRHWAPNNIKL